MTQGTILQQYTAYNVWANHQMTDWIDGFTGSDFDRTVVSSFNSIRSTIMHICDGQYVWYHRVLNLPLTDIPSKVFSGDKSAVLNLLNRSSEKFSALTADFTEAQFEEIITYPNFNGPESMPVSYMIHTCMNHSTYHRGQLVTIGRQLGYDYPPKTDFIQFAREELRNAG